MTHLEQASQILDTLLGYLGFPVRISQEQTAEGPSLQVLTDQSDLLTGRHGEVLDDIQYLVNRILLRRDPSAPRIRVDVAYYRTMKEDSMLEKVREQAARVRATGQPVTLPPMNSYHRRLVHNLFANDPELASESSPGDERFKRITLRRRG